tara:strand:+ start:387 stop:740 length:354 start_codon:yes stop_codon:yes gene_type:complete
MTLKCSGDPDSPIKVMCLIHGYESDTVRAGKTSYSSPSFPGLAVSWETNKETGIRRLEGWPYFASSIAPAHLPLPSFNFQILLSYIATPQAVSYQLKDHSEGNLVLVAAKAFSKGGI